MGRTNFGEEEAGKRDVHQDTFVERFSQNSANKPVPVETVCFEKTKFNLVINEVLGKCLRSVA